jgi:hypothetical protein
MLIAGKLSNGTVNYWSCDIDVNIGDTIVVENRNAYDIVTVVGIVRTTPENVKHFSSSKLKNAVAKIEIPTQKEEAVESE